MNIKDMQLIGSGAQADVYLYEGKAYKVFKPHLRSANAEREAEIQRRVHQMGLPVPALYDVIKLGGRVALVMEYISGSTFADLMQQNSAMTQHYLDISVALQFEMHGISVPDFPRQKERLERRITETPHLSAVQKHTLHQLLVDLPSDNQLCHSDFHVFNLIQTDDGIRIIDWADACAGCASVDACRSYLLYLLHDRDLAEAYLKQYCSKSGYGEQDILRWLPVVAGARLHEGVMEQDMDHLLALVDGR